MSDSSPPKKRWILRGFVIVALIIAVAVAVREGYHAYTHVFEPNARVEANFTVLSSSINGRVESILVRAGDQVSAGDRLATMDSNVAELDLKSLRADAEKERALRGQIEAELAYFRADLSAKVDTAESSIALLQAEHTTYRKREQLAQKNVKRVRALLDRSVVSKQRIDEANDALLTVTSNLRDLETELRTGEKKLNELLERKKQESVFLSRIAVIERNLQKIEVLREQMSRKLEDMHIYAPVAGIINEVYVNQGTYLEDGDRVFLLHEPNNIWVEANIVESDIRHVKIGQPVVIDIDAYPFEHFDGEVRTLGAVTASNIAHAANGPLDTRSAQRIPVIIDIEPGDRPLLPGMRASVNIVIR
ncbi:MAG: efflux RND transporter periplasmic adaptor subunit [Pseudomonadota bacterium]